MIFKAIILFGFIASNSALPQIQPRENTCASMPSFMSGDRIVGGQQAPSMIPWQVWVIVPPYVCGGTILDSKTILSAAHCTVHLPNNNPPGTFIRAGSINKNNPEQNIVVENIVYDPSRPYSPVTDNNDIVILKLASPLTFNTNVQPACLPTASWNPASGTKCWVSGWGALSSGGSSPTNLQYVDVPIVSQSTCSSNYPNKITSAMICAGYTQGGRDSCQGDSGGPLVCSNNGQAVITGVVSFGNGCALPNFPGVYARVTTFLSWIQSNMESGGSGGSGCGSPQWANDNWCDDENNNAGCNYDGGACCGPNVLTNYCSQCQCLDPNAQPTTTTTTTTTTTQPPSTCGSPQWANDNWCDDENNNAGCNYDGGACCGPNVLTSYCSQCQCLDPNAQPTTTTTTTTTTVPQGTCGSPQWANDNACDDENNNAGCNYDGGACCGPNVITYYCSTCACLDPNFTTTTTTPAAPVCVFPGWANDQYCDDENNTPECNYDGGACCGPNVNTTYCTQCQCKQP